MPNPSQFGGKLKIPNEFLTHDPKRPIPTCGYCKKKGYPKEQHRKLKQKESKLMGKTPSNH